MYLSGQRHTQWKIGRRNEIQINTACLLGLKWNCRHRLISANVYNPCDDTAVFACSFFCFPEYSSDLGSNFCLVPWCFAYFTMFSQFLQMATVLRWGEDWLFLDSFANQFILLRICRAQKETLEYHISNWLLLMSSFLFYYSYPVWRVFDHIECFYIKLHGK